MTFDFGTQSVRVSVFNKKGEILASEKEVYDPPYVSPKPGEAEQDPDLYFQYLCNASNRLVRNHPELISQISGITVTCFRDSAVLLDKDRKVVRPMILWLDQRFAKCEKKLPVWSRFLFSLVGKMGVINLNRKKTMSNWIQENEPENWARVDKYVPLSTYFIYRLSGNLVDSAGDCTGHYPMNFRKGQWYKNPKKHLQGQIFSLEENMLCDLVKAGSKLGEITKEASTLTGIPEGFPIYAASSDKSCETLGTGVVDETMASISLGTAATIETTTHKYKEPFHFLPAYSGAIDGTYNLDLQIYRGYWMINWFLKEFGATNVNNIVVDETDPSAFDKWLTQIPAGSDGVILQPFWGSQLDKPEVKGAIVGMSDTTTRYHLYKAIIEGIAYELRYGKEQFEKRLHTKFTSLRISGGGSKSDEICQIVSDLFGLPVSKVQTNETSSLGAAIAGFIAIGEFEDERQAVASMVRVEKTFIPEPKNVKVYNQLYNDVYKKLYPTLKDTYKYLYYYAAV